MTQYRPSLTSQVTRLILERNAQSVTEVTEKDSDTPSK
jgi:hypothetical protein